MFKRSQHSPTGSCLLRVLKSFKIVQAIYIPVLNRADFLFCTTCKTFLLTPFQVISCLLPIKKI